MKRPFLKSLTGKFVSRTVLLTLIVSLIVGVLAILSLRSLVSNANNAVAGTVANPQLEQLANDISSASSRLMMIALAVILVGTAVAGFLAMKFANQVTAPITRLRGAAAQSAAILPALAEANANGHELPALPVVELNSGDEVEDLAMSFTQMQHAAAQLAVSQPQPEAVVVVEEIEDDSDAEQHTTQRFVNLGRRTQNLLARQMSFIDEMEKDERNPANLQRLFQIDHLATRMRRNAESILVLADEGSPRRLRRSVSMHQVVQAASSEIEYFDRIAIADISGASVDGNAATDIAHLLAELLENATSFSSPEAATTVSGRKTEQGYLLEIADRGIGMQPEAMAAANARFADHTGELDAQHSPAFLGHDVVARLARRHNVAVELSETVAGGVTARLHIPESALAAEGQASTPPSAAAETAPVDQSAAAPVAPMPVVEAPLGEAPLVEAPVVDTTSPTPVSPTPMSAEEFAATQYDAPLVEAGFGDTSFADMVPADASALIDAPVAPEATPPAATFAAETAAAPAGDVAPVAEAVPTPTPAPAPAPAPVAETPVAPAAGPSELADEGWVERGLTSEQRAAIDWAISKGGSVSGASDPARSLAGVATAAEVRPGPIDAATIAELGGTTPSGFKRRRRGEEGSAVFSDPSAQPEQRVATGPRSPDQLMAFRKGIENGRAQAAASPSPEPNYAGDL